jgi:hypothetical protein
VVVVAVAVHREVLRVVLRAALAVVHLRVASVADRCLS